MERKLKFPNPLETVKIIFIKEAGYMLTYIGILCCGYYATVSLIPSQFGRIYGFNQIQIVLCHLPQSAVVSVRSSSWSHLACYQTQWLWHLWPVHYSMHHHKTACWHDSKVGRCKTDKSLVRWEIRMRWTRLDWLTHFPEVDRGGRFYSLAGKGGVTKLIM